MERARINRRELNGLALAGLGTCLTGGWVRSEEPAGDAAPLDFVDGSFSIVALPDTQIYCETYPQHFYNQTEWIVANKAKHNIQFVVHLGDITNRNTRPQWEVAQRAVQKLDGQVPYSLVLGNHDCGPGGNCSTRDTLLNEYFPLATARTQPTFGGVKDDGRLDNSYHTFSAAGQKFLVLALEWGPRDESVAWADTIVAQHPKHRVLLTTHAYMYFDETRYDWTKYGKDQKWNPHSYGTAKLAGSTNDGQQLWDKLIAKHPNFFMTLNGHVLEDGLARLTSPLPGGNEVHQMLVNYQMKTEGGQGFLRLIEFLPDGQTVQVKAFSPSTGTYKTDPQNQFVLRLNPALVS
ncbi:MAG TPA: metallophosphoesterase [Pirellulales bacterium]|jgi:hypothetical protein